MTDHERLPHVSPRRSLHPHVSTAPRWVAATLVANTVPSVIAQAQAVRSWVDALEVRLDFIPRGDVRALWAELPLPAIATCRPPREGGRFTGAEVERLALLRAAIDAGAVLVDVEWDAVDRLGDVPVPRIVSRHLFDGTPTDLMALWQEIAATGAEVVKIATWAHTLTDALRVCALYTQVTRPTIAIAMGEPGVLTRLLAPAYATAFLTYATADRERAAAPGQVYAQAMIRRYGVDRVRQGARCYGYLAPDALTAPVIGQVNARWEERKEHAVLLPLPWTPEDDLETVLQLAWDVGLRGVWVSTTVAARYGLRLSKDGQWVYPGGRVDDAPLDAPAR